MQEPFNVNRVALAAGRVALQDPGFVPRRRAEVAAARDVLAEELEGTGFGRTPRTPNFVLVEIGVDDGEVCDALHAPRHPGARRHTSSGCPGIVRVTLAPEAVMRWAAGELVAAVRDSEGEPRDADPGRIPDAVRARDLVGYGRNPPPFAWPGDARVVVNLVLVYEAGSEYSVAWGDDRNDGWGEYADPGVQPPQRDPGTETHYEYGSRAGVWRLARILDAAERARHRLGGRGGARAQPGRGGVDARARPRPDRATAGAGSTPGA